MSEDQDAPRSSAHPLRSGGETKPPNPLKFLIADPESAKAPYPRALQDRRAHRHRAPPETCHGRSGLAGLLRTSQAPEETAACPGAGNCEFVEADSRRRSSRGGRRRLSEFFLRPHRIF